MQERLYKLGSKSAGKEVKSLKIQIQLNPCKVKNRRKRFGWALAKGGGKQ